MPGTLYGVPGVVSDRLLGGAYSATVSKYASLTGVWSAV